GLLAECSPDSCAPFIHTDRQGLSRCLREGSGSLSERNRRPGKDLANHRNSRFWVGMISSVGRHFSPTSISPLTFASLPAEAASPLRRPGMRTGRLWAG